MYAAIQRGRWLEASVRHLLDQAKSQRPGGAIVLSKMAEAFFIETLRRYMHQLPPEQRSWLAGARDPVVGAALALLHREPSYPWTVAKLAAKVGASRSLVAGRFVQFLGKPPLTYLGRWRLQLAARLLQTTRKAIVHVALDVGYESEAAFNRAFKREFDLPPAQYRRELAGNGAGLRVAQSQDSLKWPLSDRPARSERTPRMRRSAKSQGVADLPIGTIGRLLHHRGTANE